MYRAITCLILLFLVAFHGFTTTRTVPDNFPTIQAAVAGAEEGDTVLVRIGLWKGPITLRDGIVLLGESMTETVIRGNKRGPVITAGNKTIIKNLTVTRGRKGILCENVDAVIDQVIVTGNRETGILCLASLPDIYNSVIYRNRGSGIFCQSTRSIKTTIMHNIIAENGYCGILLQGLSEVLIENNVILGNKQYGVWGVEEAKRSRIIYNLFYNNRHPVNVYLRKDPSNITDDPGYPQERGRYDFFSTSSIVLKGRGKDGATIGLIGGEVLSQRLTDPDEDGVTVDNDKCPGIPEDLDGFEDDDGCPDFDNDKDGIYDTQDGCPNEAEDYDGFRDEDGCNDSDNDKDGVPDSIDICKDNAETINNYKDSDGCPDEIPPGGAIDNDKETTAPVSPSDSSTSEVTTPPAGDSPVVDQPAAKPAPPNKNKKTAAVPADTAR